MGDRVIESNGGTDIVETSVDFTLPDNVENGTLTGEIAIELTGNELDNILIGNAEDNLLSGLDGKDYLNGGLGNDTLVGGGGDDTYYVVIQGPDNGLINLPDSIEELEHGGFDTLILETNRSGVTAFTLPEIAVEKLILFTSNDRNGQSNIFRGNFSR